ncbi:MAG: hypothetical protein K0S27_1552 [Gammaproteobacteria bacterium]|jgi:hypothetical protein|nr:hypothetical protein [Gammaproteobacteria bacterium]
MHSSSEGVPVPKKAEKEVEMKQAVEHLLEVQASQAKEIQALEARIATMERDMQLLAAEKAKAEQTAEQEKAEQQNRARAAAEEFKEAGAEGRMKVYSPLWPLAPSLAGGLGLWRPQPENTPPKVATFLKLVAEGKKEEAEAMLKADPALIFQSGEVTDLSHRKFHHITGFQYALWALDWKMCKMLLNYLPPHEAGLQARALQENGTAHGEHFDFGPIIRAYQKYEKVYADWPGGREGIGKTLQPCWCTEVGGAQFLLPAHVIQQFYLDGRRFPLADFKQPRLPGEGERWKQAVVSDVYTHQQDGGGLGEKFALQAPIHGGREELGAPWITEGGAREDREGIAALAETCLEQRQLLLKDLLSLKPVPV